jgi:hypothetical protein
MRYQAASAMKRTEKIRCFGHRQVTARHPTTFEVTTEDHLSPRGDCIIGIAAESGASDLSPDFKELLCRDDATLSTLLACDDLQVLVRSRGSRDFSLDHPCDLVWRRSSFVCGRTIGIGSDKAARDLPREMVDLLRQGKELEIIMTVITGAEL